jgi:ectoine hydrolase
MGHDNIVGYPDNFVQSTERHPMEHLSKVIAERGWKEVRIGLEMDNYWFSSQGLYTLRNAFGDTALHDSTGLVNWQRSVKSDRKLNSSAGRKDCRCHACKSF